MLGVMIQGTASDVGKSLVATAICRAFANEGIQVAPFKSQNMSNNSYVTIDGKEIGRAQGIQAEAAKTAATVWMNPILLKPTSDQHSEVVLFGRATETLSGKGYRDSFYEKGLEAIQSALDQLDQEFDVVIMEGAGSPVEINLKEKELVNMKVAQMADIPVILVADIDRGGVFASIIGTLELLALEERERVKGLIINKFRGDLSLFEDGVKWIEERTGIPVLGVLPHIDNHMIDGEDSLSIPASSKKEGESLLDLVVIKPPYLSNYSDIEPFYYEEDVSVRWGSQLSEMGEPDAVILPGTKSTIRDLQFFKKAGLGEWLRTYADKGGHIVGICGGYQMLGQQLVDQEGSDTGILNTEEEGLGLIPATTTFHREKVTIRVEGILHPEIGIQQPIKGYEIHLGETVMDDGKDRHFLLLNNGKAEGYYGKDGKIIGTYLHHLFHNDEWRGEWLNRLRQVRGLPLKETVHISQLKDRKYDELATQLVAHLDWKKLKEIIFNWGVHHEMD
ncbi:adenosylcobyric acid synthase [Cytobacillus eiseniae]|uniref:Cobyric acid synthase n=1 Tax=Cytobacillus eiseniae TaxID=762947 RepID=A0ABS4RJE2_9BACI|nr:cobyric acid synthase [Cytobacillus eiseniae]MBP2242414.1 adenosylcobyric acid synthase [Cytobacillus eiseniae]